MNRRRPEIDSRIREDPREGLANLFDIALVFAVGLIVALVSYHHLPELMDQDSDFTIVKNPGTENMEIIVKSGENIEIHRITDLILGGEGERLGAIYRLEDGSIIYVAENVSGSQ